VAVKVVVVAAAGDVAKVDHPGPGKDKAGAQAPAPARAGVAARGRVSAANACARTAGRPYRIGRVRLAWMKPVPNAVNRWCGSSNRAERAYCCRQR
jgi:hypothetical protein